MPSPRALRTALDCLLGSVLTLTLSACGPQPDNGRASVAAAPPAQLAELYRAAQAAGERELVVYTAFPETIALWQAFQADYPDIALKPSQSTQIYTRLASEAASGRPLGDIVLTGYGELSELARQQRLAAEVPSTAANLPDQYKEPSGYFQIPWLNVFTLAYNTQRLGADQVPQTWERILEPRHKGRFALVRFNGAGPFDAAVILLQEAGVLTDAHLQGLHDAAQLADSPGTLVTHLAQGRTDFVLWAPAQLVARQRDQGAPLELVFPEQVAILYGPGVALIRQAPHPNAARLFKAWLFTPRAQAIIAGQEYAYGTLPGAPAPPGFPSVEHFKQKAIAFDQVNAYFERYRKKTQAIWR